MIFYMTSGILLSWTLLIIMYRLNLKRFLGYPAIMDAGGTLLLGALLHGTLGGMIAAISGGLFLSLIITVLRHYYGYARYNWRTKTWLVHQGKFETATSWEQTKRFAPVIILLALSFAVML